MEEARLARLRGFKVAQKNGSMKTAFGRVKDFSWGTSDEEHATKSAPAHRCGLSVNVAGHGAMAGHGPALHADPQTKNIRKSTAVHD
jgi:hypothetical protein